MSRATYRMLVDYAILVLLYVAVGSTAALVMLGVYRFAKMMN